YPELVQAQAMIEETLLQEETRFRTTLDRGLVKHHRRLMPRESPLEFLLSGCHLAISYRMTSDKPKGGIFE
ncbi:hypothetical protein N9J94_06580, partial [Planktomarina sp.]